MSEISQDTVLPIQSGITTFWSYPQALHRSWRR